MQLNQKKSCAIFLNFTQKYQFTSRLTIDGKPLDIVDHTKLLGLIVSNDLTWSRNTQYIIKRANSRMELLRRISKFNAPIKDLVQIYITYIRSILEQSCVIWHSTLTQDDCDSLERVQKNALRNILKEKYIDYENSLHIVQLETLFKRREKLLYSFGKKSIHIEQTKHLFTRKKTIHEMNIRRPELYEVIHANTERLRNSTVPYIQRLLNKKEYELI